MELCPSRLLVFGLFVRKFGRFGDLQVLIVTEGTLFRGILTRRITRTVVELFEDNKGRNAHPVKRYI